MSTLSIPIGMMASISVYVGFYHLLIYLRRRQHREDLTFAILCFTTSLYDVFCIGLYHATSVSEGVQWQRAQLIALALFGMAFLWFVSDYTQLKSRKIIYTFSAFYIMAIFIQLLDRSSFTFILNRPSIKDIYLPLGLKITYHEAAFGVFSTFQSLIGLFAITYVLLRGINFYRRGNRREAGWLLFALGFMAAAAINDTAVSNGLYMFIYTIEYGYMGMILMMAFSLSNMVVEAAMAKESLRKSEERFRTLVETTSDWVWETDNKGIYTYASPKIYELLGYEPNEIIGKTPFDLIPPDEVTHIRDVFQQSVANQEVIKGIENTNRHKDGHLVVLETRGTPFFDVKGNLLGFRGIDRDITERRIAEQALRESEKRFRTLAEASFEGIVLTEDGIIVDCNDQTSQILGYTRGELIGMSVMDAVAPESRSFVADAIRSNQLDPYEHTALRKDGVRFPVEVRARTVQISGRLLRLTAIRDITARKRTEETLRTSMTQLQTIINSAPIVLYSFDQNGIFTFSDGKALEGIGGKPGELVGKSAFDFFSTQPGILADIHRALGGDTFSVETTIADHTYDIYHSPLINEKGENYGAIGVLVDITERKRVEDERERLITELESKNAELERFTYTVSHDLKSPLVTIRGFLGFLEKNALAGNIDQLKTDIARIQNATNKMQQLLNELLELSRIGRMMNPAESVEFEMIVKEAVELVGGRIGARGVQVDIMPDLPTIHGDRARLVEVVQNLVDNAVKFMGSQPEPRIEIGQKGERNHQVILYVKDNGIGIEAQYHERVFGLFNKLDANSDGTGVGLALVKRIIEVHDGKIWVESQGLNHGTTFYFTLPAG